MVDKLTLGRVWGIPIQLHWSFLLVLPLFAYLMGQAYFAPVEGQAALIDYAWGGLLAIALFASVIAHELGHSFVAGRYGVPIRSITLLPIGGVAEMERIPDEPGQELRVAVAGPIVSVGLGLPLFVAHELGLLSALVPGLAALPKLGTFIFWFGALNVFLGAFNLLPAFPMDGGRMLRAGLSGRLGRRKATVISAGIGRALAVGMGLLGFLSLAQGGWLLLLIALFIYLGASQEESQVKAHVTLGDLTVGEVMTDAGSVRTLSPDDTVEVVYDAMVKTRHLAFPVVEGAWGGEDAEGAFGDDPSLGGFGGPRAVGTVSLTDVADVGRAEHGTRRVRDVMREDFKRVRPDALARDLLGNLSRDEGDRLIVVEETGGGLVGVVSPTDLLRLIRILEAHGVEDEPGDAAGGRGGDAAEGRGEGTGAGHAPPAP